MQELLSQIERLHKSMRELSLHAGVPPTQYDKVLEVEDLTIEEVKDRLQFLQKVDANEYRNYHYVFNLVPFETWYMYILLGERKLKEQIALKKAQRALKKVWRVKYGFTKSHKNASATVAETECI